jgi:hypothetical protein
MMDLDQSYGSSTTTKADARLPERQTGARVVLQEKWGAELPKQQVHKTAIDMRGLSDPASCLLLNSADLDSLKN